MSSTETESQGPVSAGPVTDNKMGLLKQLYRASSDIDFPKVFRITGVVSVLLVVGSIAALLTRDLNLSIEFEGGSVWEIPSKTFTDEQAREVLAAKGIEAGEIQEAKTADGERVLRVTGAAKSVQEGVDTAVDFVDAAHLEPGQVTVNTVGPSWGADITRQAGKSLVVFMLLIALYITWTMEARMAFAALVAVVHDIVITLGVYSVFQIAITPATVISFLTILGFSLYDTIVVYDRVQENGNRLLRTGRYTYTAVMRRSLNEVVMRSVNTTVTTILPIISMLVVGKYMFGQHTLGDFSLALLIGLVLGIYSSMFVAAPITSSLKERESEWREVRTKLTNKGVDVTDTAWYGTGPDAATRAGRPGTGARAAQATGARADGQASVEEAPRPAMHQGHPPRPRKQKRKR